jgi:hypothetical protein
MTSHPPECGRHSIKISLRQRNVIIVGLIYISDRNLYTIRFRVSVPSPHELTWKLTGKLIFFSRFKIFGLSYVPTISHQWFRKWCGF